MGPYRQKGGVVTEVSAGYWIPSNQKSSLASREQLTIILKAMIQYTQDLKSINLTKLLKPFCNLFVAANSLVDPKSQINLKDLVTQNEIKSAQNEIIECQQHCIEKKQENYQFSATTN